jgi:cobalt-zinc-cadmium resistance protein CzcA
MISAAHRLQIVIPFALGLIFILLYTMFGNLRDGLLMFTGVPFALDRRHICFMAARHSIIHLSRGRIYCAIRRGGSEWSGDAGVYTRLREKEGLSLDDAIQTGALTRLRPVLMTALVASIGFLPMALATGTGAEVQRPLATVVIGGILSSTALTLLVLPVLYRMTHRESSTSA